MSKTIVIQSHRQPLPHSWMEACLLSVQKWADCSKFDYRFLDDALFDYLPRKIRAKTQLQPVVASDLARLLVIRESLESEYETAIWCDADFLIFDPEKFIVPDNSYALGREVWIQDKQGKVVAYVKVHNAFMSFKRANPFLDFYIHASEQLLAQYAGPSSPQLIGPKFLTAIHNLIKCPVAERAAVMSPLVARDLMHGGGRALDLLMSRSVEKPAGLNLCASSVVSGELSDVDIEAVIKLLSSKSTVFSDRL